MLLLRLGLAVLVLLSTCAVAQEHAQPPATTAQTQQPPLAFHCAQDGDIDPMRHAVVASAATTFLQTLLGGEPGAAWDTMTAHGQSSATRQQFVTSAVLGPLAAQPRNLTLRHTFLIHVVGTPAPGTRVTCGADPTDPMQSYNMSVVPAPEQAYTLFTADAPNNGVMFTLWLVRDNVGWKVNGYAYNVSTVAGRDAQHLWTLARTEHQHGHEFNATLLYFAANQIAQRGPDFSFGFAPQIAAEQATITRPKQISGKPPFIFDDQDGAFFVSSIGPTDAGGRLFLAVTHEIEPWDNNKDADRLNRDLISLIKRTFPEYSTAFEGILVQAFAPRTGQTLVTADETARR
jgi:hypothetical protein